MSTSNNNLNNLNSKNKIHAITISKKNPSVNQTNNNNLLFTTKIKKNKIKDKSSNNSYEKIIKDIASEVKKLNNNNITEYKKKQEKQFQNNKINPFTLINDNNNNNILNNNNNNIILNNNNNTFHIDNNIINNMDNNVLDINNDKSNKKIVNNINHQTLPYKQLIKKIANQLKIKTHPPKNKIFNIQKQPQINEIFKTDCIKSSKSKHFDFISPQYSKEKLITEYFDMNNKKNKDNNKNELIINNELSILENKLDNSNFVESFDKFLNKNCIIVTKSNMTGFGMDCRDYFSNEKYWELAFNYLLKKHNIDLEQYLIFAQTYFNEYCLNLEDYEKLIDFIYNQIQNYYSNEIINSIIHKSGYKIIEFSKNFLDDYFGYKKRNNIKINSKISKLTINNDNNIKEEEEKFFSGKKNNENIQFYRKKIIENYKNILDISNYRIEYVKFNKNNDNAIAEINNNNINNNNEEPLRISIKTNAEIQNIKLNSSIDDEKCFNLEIENNNNNDNEINDNQKIYENEEEKNNENEEHEKNKFEEKCFLKISYGKSSKRKNNFHNENSEKDLSKNKRKPWKP